MEQLKTEVKKQLKERRLLEYEGKIFQCEMDIVAFESVGDKENAAKAQKALEDLNTAYKAVEGIKI